MRQQFFSIFTILLVAITLLQPISPWCFYTSFANGDEVNEVDYSTDGQMLVIASKNNRANIYQTSTYSLIGSYNSISKSANTAKFSKDQKYIAIGYQGQSDVAIISGSSFSTITTNSVSTAFNDVLEVDFSDNSTRLLVCGGGGSNGIQIYEVGTWNKLFSDYSSWSGSVKTCKFALNGEFSAGDTGGTIKTYRANRSWRWTYSNSSLTFESLDFSPDSSLLIAGDSRANNIYIFTVTGANGAPITIVPDGQKVRGVSYNKDASLYAGGGDNKQSNFYNGTSGFLNSNLLSFTQPTDIIRCLEFNDQSKELAVGSKNKFVYIYRIKCANCAIERYEDNSGDCIMCAFSMRGCRNCNSSNYCFTCSDQYFLNSLTNLCQTCSSKITACQSCTSAANCTNCLTTYYLSSPTTCSLCYTAMKGCITCNSSTNCTTCAIDKYYRDSTTNKCVQCVMLYGCAYCNSSTVCIKCLPSFYLTGTNTCIHCSLNCQLCSSSTSCSLCDNGYYLSSSNCLACTTPCTTCSTAASCLTCIEGYYLSSPNCLPCSQKCSSCTTSTYCLSCNLGYFMSVLGTCSSCNSNCISCTSSTLCLSCNYGYYYLSASKSCNKCNSKYANCVNCNNVTCLACGVGTYWDATALSCLQCATALNGCVACQTASTCLICSNEYYLQSSVCNKCSNGCNTCSTSSICTSCLIGYYIQASSCLQCPCLACTSSTNCISCELGKYLSTGSCLFCNNSMAKCAACTASNYCTSCYLGYRLSATNSSCLQCNQPCASCDALGCLTCSIGFYLSSPNCLKCPTGCSTCSSALACSQCDLQYYLAGNQCLTCNSLFTNCTFCSSTECFRCSYIQGYFLNTSKKCQKCDLVIPNCQFCQSSAVCDLCSYKYILANPSSCTSCASLIPYCQTCTSPTVCQKCSVGSYLNAGICLACLPQCYSCSGPSTCISCNLGFTLASGTCIDCFQNMIGCQVCTSNTNCVACRNGYYLVGSNCFSCQAAMKGCLSCSSNLVCDKCADSYYLDPTSKNCINCKSQISGCYLCNSSLCLTCQQGFYLNAGTCSVCSDSNCLDCSSTQCRLCKSGYYLSSNTCIHCVTTFEGCIFCNSTNCLQCDSGYYLNSLTKQCNKCTIPNCQTCDPLAPSTKCLSCNTFYFVNSSQGCSPCNSTLPACLDCSSSSICSNCITGYYLNGFSCSQCNSLFPHCLKCFSTSCLECDTGYILNGSICSLCSGYLNGCAYCSSISVCMSCAVGFYMNGNDCTTCSTMPGCLTCKNNQQCLHCDLRYSLQNGNCVSCNSTLVGCVACSSSSNCLECDGGYSIKMGRCTTVSSQTFNNYKELRFTSEYINSSMLKHTLWVNGSTFNTNINFDLSLQTNISFLTDGGVVAFLTINSYEFGNTGHAVIFYTNNPFDFSSSNSFSQMKLIKMRLLSNIQLNVAFRLMMQSNAVQGILPSSTHTGSLYLDYDIKGPQFLASILKLQDYHYYIFGLVVTIYLFIVYLIISIYDYSGKDKGQIISHIMCMKCPALMVFPLYGEYINYCYGFMTADLPWFNQFFSNSFIVDTDYVPPPYLIFYKSLNIASTYLLPLMLISAVGFMLFLLYKIINQYKEIFISIYQFLYNFFILGLIIASMGSLQGTFYNQINFLSINSAFYTLGILCLAMIITNTFYQLHLNKEKYYKLRILIKGIILSLLHINPIYYLPFLVVIQSIFIMFEYRNYQILNKKIFILVNFLPDFSLVLLTIMNQSLLSIYLSIVCISLTIILDMVNQIEKMRLKTKINEAMVGKILQSLQDMNEKKKSSIKQNDSLNENLRTSQKQDQNIFILEEQLKRCYQNYSSTKDISNSLKDSNHHF